MHATAEAHAYVECCDRYALRERTYWDARLSARYCRAGMGCNSPQHVAHPYAPDGTDPAADCRFCGMPPSVTIHI
jgi:hypothetical protein